MNCCSRLRVPLFKWEERLFDTKPEWQDMDGKKNNIREFIHKESGWWMCNTDKRNICVFCTDENLCSLQLKYGISALPSVCRTFPRMITVFPDRVEYSLDPSCPFVVYSLKEWKTGDILIEGDTGNDCTVDPAYAARQRVMDCFAAPGKSLDDCFRKIAEIYSSDTTVAVPHLTAFQECFLRKVCAFHFWTCVLAKEGFPGIDNIGGVLLDFYAGYVPTIVECPDDWDTMSRHFSAALISYEKSIDFDLDIEGRYRDSSEPIR